MATINIQKLQDANLIVTRTLPAAGASNSSAAIDLATTTGGRIPRVELGLEVPATPSLVDAKTITYTIEDSANNSSFAAVADIPAIVTTGAGGVGAAAVSRRFKLPIGVRQYLRLTVAVLAAGGDNTGVTASLGLFF